MLFSLLKHYSDTALKVSQSVYCFTLLYLMVLKTISPRLWGMGIFNAIFAHEIGIFKLQNRLNDVLNEFNSSKDWNEKDGKVLYNDQCYPASPDIFSPIQNLHSVINL